MLTHTSLASPLPLTFRAPLSVYLGLTAEELRGAKPSAGWRWRQEGKFPAFSSCPSLLYFSSLFFSCPPLSDFTAGKISWLGVSQGEPSPPITCLSIKWRDSGNISLISQASAAPTIHVA